jgi:tRNA pseudouridine55 synthase
MATGVLLILLGSAVRLSEWMVDHDKKYLATVRLGVETDTWDATGTVVETRKVHVGEDALRAALVSLTGKQEQIPPTHSAIQMQGKRAYKLARQGVELQMEPRAVEVFSITNIVIQDTSVNFDVHCSKGTYIRSLAHDLGMRLGTGAHLAALRRTASGNLTLAQACTLAELEAAVAEGSPTRYLLPMDLAVPEFEPLVLEAAQKWAVCNGQLIAAPANLTSPLVRAYDEKGDLIAILERVPGAQLKPKKVLSQ